MWFGPRKGSVSPSLNSEDLLEKYLGRLMWRGLCTEALIEYTKTPARALVEIDATHALMSKATFMMLSDYSASQPSGVYPGKMWRRHNGIYDRVFIASGGKPEWMLCWYDESERGPDWCTTKMRKVLLTDAAIEDL